MTGQFSVEAPLSGTGIPGSDTSSAVGPRLNLAHGMRDTWLTRCTASATGLMKARLVGSIVAAVNSKPRSHSAMALRDLACYTLLFQRNAKDPRVTDIVEKGRSDAKYCRVREVGTSSEPYLATIYDAYTGAKLARVGAASDRPKTRRLELLNPDLSVPFDYSGKISFEWTFTFGIHKYHWQRETLGKNYVCWLDRKPDPSVQLALAIPADKHSPAVLEIQDYNLDRFSNEIDDRKGLEILFVTTLIAIMDAADDRASQVGPSRTPPAPPSKDGVVASSSTMSRVISQDDFEEENPNEVFVSKDGLTDAYASRCVKLLQDDSILFIIIRTHTAEAAGKAVEVAHAVKRIRHRNGLEQDGDELHQYVVEEPERPSMPSPAGSAGSGADLSRSQSKVPKVINLDGPVASPSPPPAIKTPKAWAPPPNISVYLSKIDLPDLAPGRRAAARPQPAPTTSPVPSNLAVPGTDRRDSDSPGPFTRSPSTWRRLTKRSSK